MAYGGIGAEVQLHVLTHALKSIIFDQTSVCSIPSTEDSQKTVAYFTVLPPNARWSSKSSEAKFTAKYARV